jgi:hypothetical protein
MKKPSAEQCLAHGQDYESDSSLDVKRDPAADKDKEWASGINLLLVQPTAAPIQIARILRPGLHSGLSQRCFCLSFRMNGEDPLSK